MPRTIGPSRGTLLNRYLMETMMKRADLTENILDIKRQNEWTWKHVCSEIGGFHRC